MAWWTRAVPWLGNHLLVVAIALWSVAALLVLWRAVNPRPGVGEAVRPAGLHYELSVVDRPGACVYIYSNGTGVGMTAIPKTNLGGQGC